MNFANSFFRSTSSRKVVFKLGLTPELAERRIAMIAGDCGAVGDGGADAPIRRRALGGKNQIKSMPSAAIGFRVGSFRAETASHSFH
jgi:hypothetical protein